jgi:hypothetical protein
MRAIAATKRSDTEIVDDIVRECGDASVEKQVRLLIEGLRVLKSSAPFNGYRRENQQYLAAVRKQIDKLEKTLKAAPASFKFTMLFAPNQSATLDTMYQKAEACWEYLSGEMARLRARCDRFIELGLGEHGAAGYQQERAAIAARELIEQSGKPLAWSSPTSSYRVVAGLLFEAMTGEQGRDMERACEAMARVPIRSV